MPSQNSTSGGGSTSGAKTSKNYASSVASTSSTSTSSTATSYTKEPAAQDSGSKSHKKNTKRTTAILNSAKRLLSELGEPPTAAYDRQQAAANGGKQAGPSRNDFYMPNQMPPRS